MNPYDVFISYAHLDDVPPVGVEHGWVTTFVQQLEAAVRQRLGRKELEFWSDHELAAGTRVTRELRQKIETSRTLVLFLSPSYQNSEWCRSELAAFLAANPDDFNADSVFVVEIEQIDRSQWLPHLQDLKEVRFWEMELGGYPRRLGHPVPSPDEKNRYWRRLNELAHYVSARLKRFYPDPQPPAPGASALLLPEAPGASARLVPAAPGGRPGGLSVWIAEPAADLVDTWDDLAGSLRQAGYEVRPASTRCYDRRNDEAFLQAARRDLRASGLFVQLLGGAADEPEENHFALLQDRAARDEARERGTRFLQWLPPGTRLEDLPDLEYRELAANVLTSGFERFRTFVLAKARDLAAAPVGPPPAARRLPAGTNGGRTLAICVSAHAQDRELRERVYETLALLGQEAVSTPEPDPDLAPPAYSTLVDQVIQESEGVIIVYGKCHRTWVQAQYTHTRKVLAPIRSGFWGAIAEGPPKGKPPFGISSPNLMTLDCTDGVQRDSIERFVERVREAGGA